MKNTNPPWAATKARVVFATLVRIGRSGKRQKGSALPQVESVAIVSPSGDSASPANPRIGSLAASQTSTQFSGPMPHPELMGRYEQICPGSANRIIRIAELEAQHRRSAEKAMIEAQMRGSEEQFSERRYRQIFAFIITLTALGAGAYAASHGHGGAGSVMGVGGIGAIVTAFLLGTRSQRQEEKQYAPEQANTKGKRRRKQFVRTGLTPKDL